MELGLAGRCYIVTGGSKGLGLATARELVAEGANVVLGARETAVLDQVALELGGPSHDQVFGISTDIGDPTAAERLAAAAVARFGRLDGALISGPGPSAGTALDTADEVWRESFETVMLGTLRVIRATVGAVSAESTDRAGTGGSIVMVLSTSAREPRAGLSLSNAIRPGQAMLVKELADELAPAGIRINGLMPGAIATDRTYALDARSGPPDAVRRRNEATIPLKRYGEPEEFGRVAAFLLSPASSYITGALIPVDGGMLRSP